MRHKLRQLINYRPLSILAMSAGIRDILLGIGFMAAWEQITQTLIYQNYDALVPGVSGFAVGVLLILTGINVVISSIKTNRKVMSWVLKFQSLIWLFSTLMYILNGHFLLAAIFGFFFSFPSGFIGFYVKHHAPVDEQFKSLMQDG